MAETKQPKAQKPTDVKAWIQRPKPETSYPSLGGCQGRGPVARPTCPEVKSPVATGGPETKAFVLVKPPGAKTNTTGYRFEAPAHP